MNGHERSWADNLLVCTLMEYVDNKNVDNFTKSAKKMTVEERRRRRFSEKFRKEQVSLIESGQRKISEVCRLYEVKYDSVKRWIEKYGTKELPGQLVIQTQAEVNRIKELEKQASHYKEVIGEQQVELLYLRECLTLARERLGEDFEKKIKRNW